MILRQQGQELFGCQSRSLHLMVDRRSGLQLRKHKNFILQEGRPANMRQSGVTLMEKLLARQNPQGKLRVHLEEQKRLRPENSLIMR